MSISAEIIRLKNAKESIKTAIKNKGVEVSDSLTISDYAELISGISQSNNDLVKSMIERTVTEIIIPNSVTSIGHAAFYKCTSLTNVTIPDSVTSIGTNAFSDCTSLTSIIIPDSVTRINGQAFYNSGLSSITFNPGLIEIGNYCFQRAQLTEAILPPTLKKTGFDLFRSCPLKKVYIPKSLASPANSGMFNYCAQLEEVTFENGFNANNLNLSASTLYSVETIVSWLEALADRTGFTSYTLTIGDINLAKLTEEQIAIATAKNWTLA